jgi:alpha-galactosidase
MLNFGLLSKRVRNEFAGQRAGLAIFGFWVSFLAPLHYTIRVMHRPSISQAGKLPIACALHLTEPIAPHGFPPEAIWDRAPAIRFATDWRGLNTDRQRETEVRLLWSADTLFLRFVARFRELHVYADARPDGWRDELWNRDVAEVFLQPDTADPLVYKEFEVSPNGFWIDLNISHGQKEEMKSGLRRQVTQDLPAKKWTAVLAIPMRMLTPAFDPKQRWRLNFYRVEGKQEPRFYSAWSPTMTPEPNFHVPAAFGALEFQENAQQ